MQMRNTSFSVKIHLILVKLAKLGLKQHMFAMFDAFTLENATNDTEAVFYAQACVYLLSKQVFWFC